MCSFEIIYYEITQGATAQEAAWGINFSIACQNEGLRIIKTTITNLRVMKSHNLSAILHEVRDYM